MTLTKSIYCEGIHGIAQQVVDEGELEIGTLITEIKEWGEADWCDPDAPPAPWWARPGCVTFLSSTDGGKTWYRQRACEVPR